jgi:3'(2'), 5'-bisphosphate nucleotidase
VNHQWSGAVEAVVEVGGAVALLRQTLAAEIARDRLAAQGQADMFAHGRLMELLTAMDPGTPIVSEEDPVHAEGRPDAYWLIDPIDGTASWSGGFDGFVCQVARIESGVAVFGAIHAPVLGLTWEANRGTGAYLNGELLASSSRPLLSREVVVVDNYPEANGVSRDLLEWLGDATYREFGSIGLKAALVASGEADIFIKDVVVRDWDVAPALALAHEVGASVTRIDGTPFLLQGSYAKRDGLIVASDATLGSEVARWLAGAQSH